MSDKQIISGAFPRYEFDSVAERFYPSIKEIKGPSFGIPIVMSATDLDFSDCLKREADAKLIAAAPDMLQALRDIIKLPGMSQGAMIICTAAILQATGEMP